MKTNAPNTRAVTFRAELNLMHKLHTCTCIISRVTNVCVCSGSEMAWRNEQGQFGGNYTFYLEIWRMQSELKYIHCSL